MLNIEYVDINSIKPYENNAKLHPREQIEQIKKSIQEFGMDDPIGIWNDEIVEGHGRLIACKELGYQEIPIIRLDHLTDDQRKAYTLVHNKLTMNSDFDMKILNEELQKIVGFDMGDFGFPLQIEDIDIMNNGTYEEPEQKIAVELNDRNDYIVMEFDNEADWDKALDVFKIERVATCDKNEKVRRYGYGRVIKGKDVLAMLEGKENEN